MRWIIGLYVLLIAAACCVGISTAPAHADTVEFRPPPVWPCENNSCWLGGKYKVIHTPGWARISNEAASPYPITWAEKEADIGINPAIDPGRSVDVYIGTSSFWISSPPPGLSFRASVQKITSPASWSPESLMGSSDKAGGEVLLPANGKAEAIVSGVIGMRQLIVMGSPDNEPWAEVRCWGSTHPILNSDGIPQMGPEIRQGFYPLLPAVERETGVFNSAFWVWCDPYDIEKIGQQKMYFRKIERGWDWGLK